MKKTLAIFLFLTMLMSSLPSCGDTQTSGDSSVAKDTATVQDEETAAVEETKRRMHALPESLDFEGASFNIMYPKWQGYKYYFFADEATGDAMNDAIYYRTIGVEDYLKVDITQFSPGKIGDIYPALKQSVVTDDDTYQLALTHCILNLVPMVTEGLLYNYDDLSNVDYTADWWNREMMDELRLGQNTYFGVSDYMIPCPYAIFFSKDLVQQYGLQNPYEMVYSGDWTIDQYMDMATSIVSDADGDGQVSDKDIFGICCDESSKYISFMTGCDQFMTTRDANGRIVLDMYTEKLVSLVERFVSLSLTDRVIAAEGSLSLSKGNLLFEHRTIADAVVYRDLDMDIGILPYPKYDATQKDYISLDWGGLMGIPSSIRNPAMVGAVLELLAFESGNEVIPTYYDVLLEGKLARDEDSIAMLNILFDTIAYEVGGNYFGFNSAFGDLFYTIPRLAIEYKSTDFASEYQSRETAAKSTIESFYESLDKIETNP